MFKPIDLNLLLSKIGDKLGLVWIDPNQNLLENNEVQALDLNIYIEQASSCCSYANPTTGK